jgi:hypothetical protein
MTDPAQWSVADSVLVRAVVFDGLRVDHPAVSRLLDVLAPVAEAELAYEEALEDYSSGWDEERPEFPWMDGPVFLLGGALGDASSLAGRVMSGCRGRASWPTCAWSPTPGCTHPRHRSPRPGSEPRNG